MLNNHRIHIFGIALLFVLFIFVELLRPKPIDWSNDFTPNNTKPYSVKALHSLVQHLFDNKVQDVYDDIYTQVDATGDSTIANYLFINNRFEVDSNDLNELLYLAEGGSNVLISAQEFPEQLKEILHFETKIGTQYDGLYDEAVGMWVPDTTQTQTLRIRSPQLPVDSFSFVAHNMVSFIEMDTQKHHAHVLGTGYEGKANFVYVPFRNGVIYLHTAPHVFTNYHLLTDNHAQYAEAVLSRLPADLPLWFDLHYVDARPESPSIFRFLLANEALRWALYLATIALLLFLLFSAKRRQRYIPIILPLRNSTVDFVKTLGRLYYHENDNKDLADKKITYFWAYLHQKYHAKITYTPDFYQWLSQKTALPIADIRSLFEHIIQIKTQHSISEASLLLLNQQLDRFYEHTQANYLNK